MAKQLLAGRIGNSGLVVFNKYELKSIRLTDNSQSVLLPHAKLVGYRTPEPIVDLHVPCSTSRDS